MPILYLQNPVSIDHVLETPEGATPQLPLSPKLVGGYFKVSTNTSLRAITTPRKLHSPSAAAICTVIGNHIIAPLAPNQTIPTTVYEDSLPGYVGCRIVNTLYTADTYVTAAVSTGTQAIFTVSNAPSSGSGGSLVVFLGNAQSFMLYDIDLDVSLGTLNVAYQNERLTFFGSPINLVPNKTYAAISVVGGDVQWYSDTQNAPSDPFIILENGFIDDWSTPVVNDLAGITATTKAGSNQLTFPGTAPVNAGDWVWVTGGILGPNPCFVYGISVAGGKTTVTFAGVAGATTTGTLWAFNANTMLTNVSTGYLSGRDFGARQWMGDFLFDAVVTITEPIDPPPPPTVTGQGVSVTDSSGNTTIEGRTPGSFTISLDSRLLPADAISWDLQFAKAPDNVLFGDWLDVGNFPVVTTPDASASTQTNLGAIYTHQAPDTASPNTTTALPYYIYRYRVWADGGDSSTDWSTPAVAGQIPSS